MSSLPPRTRSWRGVAWPPLTNGVCSKHADKAAMCPSGICMTCHHEQLDAARRGSREFEKKTT